MAGAEKPPNLLASSQPDYRAYFLERLDGMRSSHFQKPDAFLRDGSHIHVASLAAASEVRAWQWTQDQQYANRALERLRLIAAKADAIREADFFTPYPLSFAYQGLANGRMVDDGLREAMVRFVTKRFVPRDFTGLNNQTLVRACGLALAAQVWPELEPSAKWRDYARTICGLLEQVEDVPENAPNYNTFDLVGTFLLADLLNKRELLAKDGIKAMCRRFRDQVSPLGWIPPYGDSGSASNPFDPNWPMNSPWAPYVAAFERAAREYRDSTLRWAAARMAQSGERHQPLGRRYGDISDLFYMGFAVDWADAGIAPQMPSASSEVLTRRDFRSAQALDKLILSPSRRPGAPFVLCDLYVRGAHGHVNQHGSINYFEHGDFPLLTVLGYNSRDPEHTNLVMMRPALDAFPHVEGIFAPGVWHEADLPTSRLPAFDLSRPHLRRISAVNMRVTAGRNGVVYWADDLRLTGPGRNPVVLDDFEEARGWRGSPGLSDDAPQGKHSLTWTLPPGVHFLEKGQFDQVLDCREYPSLKFKWKLSNNDETARPIILRVHSGDQSLDFHAHAVQLCPTLLDAKVEQRGQDQYGVMRFSGWFTADTTLRRQMVLTGSGVLIVRDVLVPGEMAKGMVAGPIWHMGPVAEPRAGPNWFNSSGGKTELLTWFEPSQGRSFGFQTVNVWSKDHQQTVFAKQTLETGKSVCFVTVLVPHEPSADAAALADKISAEDAVGRSSIRIGFPRDRVRVEIADEDEWTLTRD